MNSMQAHALLIRETDIAGTLERLSGDEKMYEVCLSEFLHDTTAEELNQFISKKLWDEAFTAAHALKGLAGNLGFVPLMHYTGYLIVTIRGGKINDIPSSLEKLNSSYRDIIDGIEQYFRYCDVNTEGE